MVRSIRTLVAVLLLCIVPTIGVANASTHPPPRSELQAAENAIVAAGAPGVSAEVRDEHGTWTGVAGLGDVRRNSRPNVHGEFRIGSVTKSFTATMVLQLVAEKRIRLDAPIKKYLPGLLPYKRTITVRDLLQHRTGLFEYGNVVWPDPQTTADRRFNNYTPAQLVKIATEHPLQPNPDRKFLYSNTDYIVLGMLIEKITHSNINTELRHRILRPAGLHHTYLAGAFPFLLNPAARGYEALGASDGPLTDLTAFNMTVSWTAGAIVSTAADVNRFYAALLTGKLLPAAQLTQMKRTIAAFPGFGYGLGLAGGELCGHTIWGHVGGVPGYETYSFTDSGGGRQVTVMVNRGLTVDGRVDEAITSMLATEFCGSR